MGLLGKHLMPELSQALAGQLASGDIGSGDVKVFVNRKVSFSTGSPTPTLSDPNSIQAADAQNAQFVNSVDSSPIMPARSSSGAILRFLLTLAMICSTAWWVFTPIYA